MLATENEVVALGTKGDGDALAEKDESEAVAILVMRGSFDRVRVATKQHTFSLHSLKKPMGSRPYDGAEPRKGIQCQTIGGWDFGPGILTHRLYKVRGIPKKVRTHQLPQNIKNNRQHGHVDQGEQE